MKKLWNKIGVIAFWVGWPALWLYLRMSRRTRVLIVCGDEFLALKGWLGADKWILPGGGLHRNESPVDGAVREVGEETGIVLDPDQLQFLYSGHKQGSGFRFNYEAFAVVLLTKPNVMRQKREIVETAWLPMNNTQAILNSEVADILAYWQNQL